MATTTEEHKAEIHQEQAGTQQQAGPVAESLPSAPPPQPADQPEVCWGDWFALKFWLYCFLLMGAMIVYDLITGILRKW